MKKISLMIPVLFVFFACNNTPKAVEPEVKEAPEMGTSSDAQLHIPVEQLAIAIDPVCEMSVAESQADTMSYEGKLYGFCGVGCKKSFAENPASYIK